MNKKNACAYQTTKDVRYELSWTPHIESKVKHKYMYRGNSLFVYLSLQLFKKC